LLRTPGTCAPRSRAGRNLASAGARPSVRAVVAASSSSRPSGARDCRQQAEAIESTDHRRPRISGPSADVAENRIANGDEWRSHATGVVSVAQDAAELDAWRDHTRRGDHTTAWVAREAARRGRPGDRVENICAGDGQIAAARRACLCVSSARHEEDPAKLEMRQLRWGSPPVQKRLGGPGRVLEDGAELIPTSSALRAADGGRPHRRFQRLRRRSAPSRSRERRAHQPRDRNIRTSSRRPSGRRAPRGGRELAEGVIAELGGGGLPSAPHWHLMLASHRRRHRRIAGSWNS
jgi:hypothetical protein